MRRRRQRHPHDRGHPDPARCQRDRDHHRHLRRHTPRLQRGHAPSTSIWVPKDITVTATLLDAAGTQSAKVTDVPVTTTVFVPPPPADEPADCTREDKPDGGQTITCANGIPAHRYLNGTDGPDTINVTGTVDGTVNGGTGSDTITITPVADTRTGAHAVGKDGKITASPTSSVTATGTPGKDFGPVPSPPIGGTGNAGTIIAGTVTVTGGKGETGEALGGIGNSGTITATTVTARGGNTNWQTLPAGAYAPGGTGNSGTITLTGDDATADVSGGRGKDYSKGNTGLIKGGNGVNTISVRFGPGDGYWGTESPANTGTIDGNYPPAIKSTCTVSAPVPGAAAQGVAKNCTTGNYNTA